MADENNQADIRAYVKRRLRAGFRLIKDSRAARRAHLLRLQVVRDMLDPLSRANVGRLSRTFSYAPQEQYRVICAKAAGVFMYAKEVLSRLDTNPHVDLQSLPSGLAELYMSRYRETFAGSDALDQFEAHTKPMLLMLAAARSALPESLVVNAKSSPDLAADPTFQTTRRQHLAFVKRMCVGSLAEEAGLLQYSHKTFADWLLGEASGSFRLDQGDGERLLAEVCLGLVRGGGGGEEESAAMRYALRHGVSHLVAAGR